MKRLIYIAAALAAGGAGYVSWLQTQSDVELTNNPDAGVPCPEGEIPCQPYDWVCVPEPQCPP